MAYQQLNINLVKYPNVKSFIQGGLELYFCDVHSLLRLPLRNSNIPAGCNFTIAQALLATISGISTTLFVPTSDATGRSGALLKQCLVKFYPWDQENNLRHKPELLAEILYYAFRNPLVHNLGILANARKQLKKSMTNSPRKFEVMRMKNANGDGLDEKAVEVLESSNQWPFLPTFANTLRFKADKVFLNVERFYWGIREMVCRLTQDEGKMKKAEQFFVSLK